MKHITPLFTLGNNEKCRRSKGSTSLSRSKALVKTLLSDRGVSRRPHLLRCGATEQRPRVNTIFVGRTLDAQREQNVLPRRGSGLRPQKLLPCCRPPGANLAHLSRSNNVRPPRNPAKWDISSMAIARHPAGSWPRFKRHQHAAQQTGARSS